MAGESVLFTNQDELQKFKIYMGDAGFAVYAEGEAEISTLVARFQREQDRSSFREFVGRT